MNYNDRFGANSYRKESFFEKLHNKHGKKVVLWIAVAALWALVILVVISLYTSSRRFEFDGNNLRVVTYAPRDAIKMVDGNGNYLIATASGAIGETITVEYLGETFSYNTMPRRTIGNMRTEPEARPTQRRLAEISFIQQVRETVRHGLVSSGTAVACVVISLPVLILSVAAFLYPDKFWEFEQAFNFRVQNAEPTEWGIMVHQIGGVGGVIMTFIFIVMILTF